MLVSSGILRLDLFLNQFTINYIRRLNRFWCRKVSVNYELHMTRKKAVVASFKLFRRNFQKELWDTTRILSEWQVDYQARGWKLNKPNIAMISWVGIVQLA